MSSLSSRIKENKPFAALRLFASPMFFQAIVFKNELSLKQNQKIDNKKHIKMKSLSSKIKEKCNSATICIVAQHAKMNCLSSKIKQSSQRCTVMSSSLSKITENNSVAVFGVMRRLCFSNQVFDKSFILHGSWSQCPFRNSKDVGISEHKSCLGILLDDCGRNNI